MQDTSSKATGCIPSHNHLTALCDHASDALFLLDTRHHCIFMNRAAEILTGYTLDEISGRPLRDVIGESTDGPLRDGFPIASGQPERDILVARSGQIHPIVYTASPLGEDGDVTGTVLEMHRAEDDLPAIEALKEETRIL
ncbi:MAG: PAS domain-containing protein, partial [Limimaricola soesokkakensis]|uniref:PAS domain-containing protein n=1 Tax=Limimaricola soesokkakensis TaxID=1343159 RepID=UPI004058E315